MAINALWNGATGDYNLGTNWFGDQVPSADGTATFGGSGSNSVFISQVTTVADWVFQEDSQDYNFTIGSGFSLQFDGDGIAINNGSATISNSGTLTFNNSSTASTATITTNNGGRTNFLGSSDAAHATLIANDTGIGDAGVVDFSGHSSAMDVGSIAGSGNFELD